MINIEIIIKSILLGIIEGLTEFIPVSSTAHLSIASQILDFHYVRNGVFEISIQLGAIFAILLLYRKKITNVAQTLHKDKLSRSFIINLLLAFTPTAIVGVLFHDLIKWMLFSPKIIASSLALGGVAIIVVEKSSIQPKYHSIEKLPKFVSILIGILQSISVIPGVSRSGATIIGSLLLKLDRKISTEFSFFLAIPTIFGATIYDIYKNYDLLDISNFEIIFVGFCFSFLSSIIVVRWLVNFVSNHNFLPFAYYRIVIGLLIWITILIY